jgi:hypothetical protein
MAGYSGTPLVKKLGIKENHRVALLAAPLGFDKTLGKLPAGVRVAASLAGREPLDVIVAFFERRADLEAKLASLRERMAQNGGLWIGWPKKASKRPTDITEDVVRAICLPTGLVDNKVCALDDVWSGLRLVIRLENRR